MWQHATMGEDAEVSALVKTVCCHAAGAGRKNYKILRFTARLCLFDFGTTARSWNAELPSIL